MDYGYSSSNAPETTEEMVAALRTLRQAAMGGYDVPDAVRRAVNTLDNSGIFASVDIDSDYASAL